MKITLDAHPQRRPAGGPVGRPSEIQVGFFTTADCGRLNLSRREFAGEPGSTVHLHDRRLLAVGLGAPENINADALRRAAGTAIRFLKGIGAEEIFFDVAAWPEHLGALVEGIRLGAYTFETYKKSQTPLPKRVRLNLTDAEALKRAEIVAEATNAIRELGNQPGNVIYPETFAEEARRIGKAAKLKVTVLAEEQLKAGKFGGLLAVGGGSARGPRLIVLEHRGGPASQAPIVMVGKAITFDTGGISIKPAADMEELIFDKCGGTAVLGAMSALARLKVKRNVVGLIASAENMPGPDAYRPGDILTLHDGKHVEVINTDAEGRLVLADAFAYARKRFRPEAIIDLATLTGACGVALGEHAAGLWSNSSDLLRRLLESSERTAERLWPMPLYPEYREQIQSQVALVKNSAGRMGGACTAAAFLQVFAEETPWAHLDVAYTANTDKERPHLARGATGFGVRTLVDLITRW